MTSKSNEPWSAWAESMQKMMSSPAAMNPFAGMMGAMPGMPNAAGAGAFDPQQFMKALDPVEIDRRIQDLRAVEAWMKLSLSGIEMSIKTMQMQRDAYASFHKMSEEATQTMNQGASAAATAKSAKRAARPTARKR
jgi:hypothetical protein